MPRKKKVEPENELAFLIDRLEAEGVIQLEDLSAKWKKVTQQAEQTVTQAIETVQKDVETAVPVLKVVRKAVQKTLLR
jgi:hypothetical protein